VSDRNCVVLAQHRTESEYNDFVGRFYHFPRKYLRLLSEENLEFGYYEPTKRGGSGVYFGYGRLGRIFPDKRETGHYFAEVIEYRPFAEDVPFLNDQGEPRESGPSYNPQNSARRIEPDALDGICLDGGFMLPFTADAHLVKVLGEELIASEVVGVLELVKNAYDANATKCGVRIEGIPELPDREDTERWFPDYDGPVIVVEDNGDGMDKEIIELGWMRPASTIKTSSKERLKAEKRKAIQTGRLGAFKSLVRELKKHHGGRLPLGEKGVGRFATHRLGRHLVLQTKTRQTDFEYQLRIDWNELDETIGDKPIDLASKRFSLTRQAPSRDYGTQGSGTRLIMYGGREGYTLAGGQIREINRSLLKLKSPRSGPQDFDVSLECPQIPDLDETPIAEEFPPAFSLDLLLDGDGLATIDLAFTPSGVFT